MQSLNNAALSRVICSDQHIQRAEVEGGVRNRLEALNVDCGQLAHVSPVTFGIFLDLTTELTCRGRRMSKAFSKNQYTGLGQAVGLALLGLESSMGVSWSFAADCFPGSYLPQCSYIRRARRRQSAPPRIMQHTSVPTSVQAARCRLSPLRLASRIRAAPRRRRERCAHLRRRVATAVRPRGRRRADAERVRENGVRTIFRQDRQDKIVLTPFPLRRGWPRRRSTVSSCPTGIWQGILFA